MDNITESWGQTIKITPKLS